MDLGLIYCNEGIPSGLYGEEVAVLKGKAFHLLVHPHFKTHTIVSHRPHLPSVPLLTDSTAG